MKLGNIAIFWLLTFKQLCASEGLDFLFENKPIEYPVNRVPGNQSGLLDLYKKQLAILQSLPAEHQVKDSDRFVGTLVTYLNYTPSPIVATSAPMPPPSLDEVKSTFPAFALLISVPGLDASLRKYVLSRDMEKRLRLAALAVLRHRNRSMFLDTERALKEEPWTQTPEIVRYLKFLEDDGAFFWGMASGASGN